MGPALLTASSDGTMRVWRVDGTFVGTLGRGRWRSRRATYGKPPHCALADDRVVAIGQTANKIVRIGGHGGGDDFV